MPEGLRVALGLLGLLAIVLCLYGLLAYFKARAWQREEDRRTEAIRRGLEAAKVRYIHKRKVQG